MITQDLDHALDVRRALARLSVGDREVLWLAYVEGHRSVDLGAILGVRADAARQRLARAARRMRIELGADYRLADHETNQNETNQEVCR